MTKHLDSLKIENFRMLEDFEVAKLGQVNLIVGKNNSGKSTVLEALRIYAGNAQSHLLKDIAQNHDEKYEFSELENHSSNVNIPFLDLFTHRATQSYLNLSIGDNFKKLELIYVNLKLASTDISEKYQHFINTNQLFFGQKNAHHLFFAINSAHKFYHINLNKADDLHSSAHYEQLIEIPCSYIPVNLLSMRQLAYLWDEIYKEGLEEISYDVLKTINPNFQSLIFIENPQNPTGARIPYISIISQKRRIPLKSEGYGTQRLLQIALSIYKAKDGFLLIDEFENGLHYSVQEKVWNLIFEMAKRLNIQVFATTHSWDCIEAFSKVAKEREDVEGLLFRMGRSAKTSDKGKVIATIFDEEKLQRFTQADMEVR